MSFLRLLHSFIFQITSDNKDLRPVLSQAFQANERQISSCVDVARDLFKGLIDDLPVYIIVDGLDEITVRERSSILNNLLQLYHECPNLRLLVSSRGEYDILKLLKPCVQMIRVHNENSQDIQAYVNKRTDEWLSRLDLDDDDMHDLKDLLEPIAKRSKGDYPL